MSLRTFGRSRAPSRLGHDEGREPIGSLTESMTKAYIPSVVHRVKRSDDGVVLVEFALVSVVFFALLFGGLFVLMEAIAKGQVTSGVTSGAQLAVTDNLGGAVSSNCLTNPPLNPAGQPATGNTLTLLCEIEETIGTDVLGTAPSSLQVAISCVTQQNQPTRCGSAVSVRVCARTWAPWNYPVIISPGWITFDNEQSVPSGSAPLNFSNFTPKNTYNSTPALTCP